MSYSIQEIEGIGVTYKRKLAKAGLKTTASLLNHCCTRKGRKTMAESSGISEKHLLKWTNLADLMRIKGIATQYSELLEASGVDTVKELRNRNAANLAQKMAEVNAKKKLSRRSPPESVVAGWIDRAKNLDPMMTY